MDLVEFHGPQYVHRVLELLVRLAGEADDQVGSDGDAGNRFSNLGDLFEVFRLRITAPHPLEHLIVARLEGKIDQLAYFRKIGDRLDDSARHVAGV